MDLSKLPRMSKTPSPPASTAQPESGPTPPPSSVGSTAGSGAACAYCAAPLRPAARFCDNCGSPVRTSRDVSAGIAAEAWISVGIGLLLLIFCPTMVEFALHNTIHTHFAPYDAFDAEGNPVTDKDGRQLKSDQVTMQPSNEHIPYRKTVPNVQPNFWNDLAITAFAFALILEGVALVLSRRPMVVAFALLVTVGATLLNLGFFLATVRQYGIPLMSCLAVIFGVYMAIFQFRLLQVVRADQSPAYEK